MTGAAVTNPWQELIQTCVLGSGRRQAQICAQGALGALIDDLQESAAGQSGAHCTEEEKILMALSATSLALRAGQVPVSAGDLGPAPAPCDQERQDVCSTYSITLLNHVLVDQPKGDDLRRSRLVRDWLTFCREESKIVASDHLPRLLDFAREREDLHQLLADCGGIHFYWLLNLNTIWQKSYKRLVTSGISATMLVEQIELGLDEERKQAFVALRKADPATARNCLVTLWEKESVEQKLALLKSLSTNLSMEDEPFLEETALADRRKEIRRAAASSLAILPESRLLARMKERAANFVIVEKNKGLEITLPDVFDKSMARDEMEETVTVDSRMGQKAGWLYQTISLVDPAFWYTHTGLSAGAFLQLILTSDEWSLPIVLGLLNASALYRNNEYQDVIISFEEIHLTESVPGKYFLSCLPTEKLERLILSKLPTWAQTDRRSAPRLDLWYYLELVDFQWSERFSVELLRFIIKEIKEKVPVFGHTFYSNASNFGLRMHVGAGKYLADLNLAQVEMDTWTRNGLERFVDNLRLRCEMHQSFKCSDKDCDKAYG